MRTAHYDKGLLWLPASAFAREYNKSRVTIVRWIESGFIFQLGCQVKKDVRGHWFIGRVPSEVPPTQSARSELTV